MEAGNVPIETRFDLFVLFCFEFFGTALLLLGVNMSQGNPFIVLAAIFAACMLTAR